MTNRPPGRPPEGGARYRARPLVRYFGAAAVGCGSSSKPHQRPCRSSRPSTEGRPADRPPEGPALPARRAADAISDRGGCRTAGRNRAHPRLGRSIGRRRARRRLPARPPARDFGPAGLSDSPRAPGASTAFRRASGARPARVLGRARSGTNSAVKNRILDRFWTRKKFHRPLALG